LVEQHQTAIDGALSTLWSDSALGASFGLYRDLQGFGSAVGEGDRDKIAKKGELLLPFNFYFRFMHQLHDATKDD